MQDEQLGESESGTHVGRCSEASVTVAKLNPEEGEGDGEGEGEGERKREGEGRGRRRRRGRGIKWKFQPTHLCNYLL